MDEADYPAIYRAADTASQAAQRLANLGVILYSIFLILAAYFGAVSVDFPELRWVAVISLALSLLISLLMLTINGQDKWYRARAVAESAKTLSWRYCMCAEPFSKGLSDTEARLVLVERLRRILNEHRDLAAELAGRVEDGDQITGRMSSIRALTLGERVDFYFEHRIEEQHRWYRKKAKLNRRVGFFWFGLIWLLHVAGLGALLLRPYFENVNDWHVSVIVVLASSTLTWIQFRRYRELAAAYSLTEHEIGFVRAVGKDFSDDEAFAVFVDDSESAFSREHTQWLARKSAT